MEEGAADAVRRLNEAGYLVVLVTNQPVVARGLCGIEDVKLIHKKMQMLLGKRGRIWMTFCFVPIIRIKDFPRRMFNIKYPVIAGSRPRE